MEGLREKRAGRARILLVDDHASFRQGVAAALEGEPDLGIVGQAGSLAEARGMLHETDVGVFDLGLPDGFGGDLIRALRAANPRAQALVLSSSSGPGGDRQGGRERGGRRAPQIRQHG